MATPESHTFIRRSLAILAAMALLTGMLAISASRPTPVDATFGFVFSKFKIETVGPYNAGVPFKVVVTAQDAWGFRVPSYSGANAALQGLPDAPSTCTVPPAPTCQPTYPAGTWSNGVGTYWPTAVRAGSSTITVRDAVRNVSRTSSAFTVSPGTIVLTFTAQPRDAQVGTPIESSYAEGDYPVKVLAADAYGNPAPSVGISGKTDPGGAPTPLDGTTTQSTDANGVASFNNLSIGATGTYRLTATAGTAIATSVAFQIVLDLAVCSGDSCTGQATVGGRTDRQTTFSSIEKTTTSSFNDVALTTSFIGGSGAVECLGGDRVFGQVTDVRVVGDGITDAKPSFLVALIVPKSTLQALGLTARNAASFDVCLGAVRLDGGTSGWTGKATAEDPDPATSLGTDGAAWWGWVADCGTVGAYDPCVKIKTKNAGQLQSALGLSPADFKKLGFSSSDLGIVVQKTWPWDGRMGLK